jgi:DNA-binding IclR family transcriptional regulator
VHLVTFDPASAEVVYIDKVESAQPVRMHSRIGSRQPAHCTAVGKVFLAHAAEEIVEKVIASGLPSRTDRTITSPQRLRTELGTVRLQGYAVDDIENEPDIRCVAAPVFDHGGTVVTAVSVSGPASRVTRERTAELAALLLESTAEISRGLGASVQV